MVGVLGVGDNQIAHCFNAGTQDDVVELVAFVGGDFALIQNGPAHEGVVEQIEVLLVEVAHQDAGLAVLDNGVHIIQRVPVVQVGVVDVQVAAAHIQNGVLQDRALGVVIGAVQRGAGDFLDGEQGQDAQTVLAAIFLSLGVELIVVAHRFAQDLQGFLIVVPLGNVVHFLQNDDVSAKSQQVSGQSLHVVAVQSAADADVVAGDLQLHGLGDVHLGSHGSHGNEGLIGLDRAALNGGAGNGEDVGACHIVLGPDLLQIQIITGGHGDGLDVHFIVAVAQHKAPDGAQHGLGGVALEVDGLVAADHLHTGNAQIPDGEGNGDPFAVLHSGHDGSGILGGGAVGQLTLVVEVQLLLDPVVTQLAGGPEGQVPLTGMAGAGGIGGGVEHQILAAGVDELHRGFDGVVLDLLGDLSAEGGNADLLIGGLDVQTVVCDFQGGVVGVGVGTHIVAHFRQVADGGEVHMVQHGAVNPLGVGGIGEGIFGSGWDHPVSCQILQAGIVDGGLGNGENIGACHIVLGPDLLQIQIVTGGHGDGLDVHFIVAVAQHKAPDGAQHGLGGVALEVDGLVAADHLHTGNAQIPDGEGNGDPFAVLHSGHDGSGILGGGAVGQLTLVVEVQLLLDPVVTQLAGGPEGQVPLTGMAGAGGIGGGVEHQILAAGVDELHRGFDGVVLDLLGDLSAEGGNADLLVGGLDVQAVVCEFQGGVVVGGIAAHIVANVIQGGHGAEVHIVEHGAVDPLGSGGIPEGILGSGWGCAIRIQGNGTIRRQNTDGQTAQHQDQCQHGRNKSFHNITSFVIFLVFSAY